MDTAEIVLWLQTMLALIWASRGVKLLMGQILINLIVALAAAINQKQLDLSKLADFFIRKIIPYVAVMVVARFAGAAAELAWLSAAVWAIIETSLLANLAENLALLGVPMPALLTQRITTK